MGISSSGNGIVCTLDGVVVFSLPAAIMHTKEQIFKCSGSRTSVVQGRNPGGNTGVGVSNGFVSVGIGVGGTGVGFGFTRTGVKYAG